MTWIKRNLYFLILSVVGLALMGAAGWYLYSQWKLNNDILSQLSEQYAELDRLAKENPHPGTPDGKVDNIKLAKEQQQQLREFMTRSRALFKPVPRIPNEPKVTDQGFTSALHRTIDQLQHAAASTSVTLQSGYAFSFAAEYNKMVFAPGSLEPLSAQLGEVKEICDVLFKAKINSLDSLRRERVSADDLLGTVPDYLEEHSTTNELAVLTPYEVTFKCFSPELAAALSGLGGSPHCLLVKAIHVALAAAGPGTAEALAMVPPPIAVAQPPPQVVTRPGDAEGEGGGRRGREMAPQNPYMPPPMAATTAQTTVPGVSRGGLPIVLDERQLLVTMTIEVVKLLPAK